MTPTVQKRIDAVVWAVRLGANTTDRLSAEWCVTNQTAASNLKDAFRRGFLKRRSVQDGHAKYFVYEAA